MQDAIVIGLLLACVAVSGVIGYLMGQYDERQDDVRRWWREHGG